MFKKLVCILGGALIGVILACAPVGAAAGSPLCQGTGVVQFVANGHVSMHSWLKRHKQDYATVLSYTMTCGDTPRFDRYVNRQNTHLKMARGTTFWGIQWPTYPG